MLQKAMFLQTCILYYIVIGLLQLPLNTWMFVANACSTSPATLSIFCTLKTGVTLLQNPLFRVHRIVDSYIMFLLTYNTNYDKLYLS